MICVIRIHLLIFSSFKLFYHDVGTIKGYDGFVFFIYWFGDTYIFLKMLIHWVGTWPRDIPNTSTECSFNFY